MKFRSLLFPVDNIEIHDEVAVLRDFEVMGVGSLRKYQLEQLRKSGPIILQTYRHLVPLGYEQQYEKELDQLKGWLQPVGISSVHESSFEAEAQALFLKIFPLLTRVLGRDLEKLLLEYLSEAPRSSLLLQDFWCYFVGFLRLKKIDIVFVELANWEWTAIWLETRMDYTFSGDQGQLMRSPHVEVIQLSQDNPYIDRSAGSYVFYFNRAKNKIEKVALEPQVALAFDLLEEDRKYSIQGLRDQLELRSSDLNLELGVDVERSIEEMIELGLLIQLR